MHDTNADRFLFGGFAGFVAGLEIRGLQIRAAKDCHISQLPPLSRSANVSEEITSF
jgi:hypothetical protein